MEVGIPLTLALFLEGERGFCDADAPTLFFCREGRGDFEVGSVIL